jgi:hypothetical protein
MPVNKEIKGNLARLLATEDLVVEHKNVATASFNVDTRVLILPQWDKASNEVYDMLVGHEVGHALYTPNRDIPKSIPHQFVNVVEDARIEKLMKRRYAGLNKTFFRGYTELHQEDFFQVEDDDISTFNLADRANLYYKIGSLIEVPFFNEQENDLIKRIGSTETFEDVLEVARDLYEYCKQPDKDQERVGSMQNTETNAGGGELPDDKPVDETIDKSQPQESPVDSQVPSDNSDKGEESLPQDIGGETNEDPEVRTADSLEDSIRDLIQSMDQNENMYLELPKLNLDTVIASNTEIHDYIDNWWDKTISRFDGHYTYDDVFGSIDSEYVQFKRDAQKEVSYLVKEFECKKAADSYARSTTSRTGVLDCTKLHSYKYNEDLFKKVTTLSDGKNHGLIFILDWSGSMGRVMADTIKQLYNLVWFCKKVAIPFEVYAFSQEWRRNDYDQNGQYVILSPHYEKKHGLVHVSEQFSLMNILTSKTNAKTLEKQMINIWRICKEFGYNYRDLPKYTHPCRLALSGTPLNETMIALHQILPEFQKEHKLQKVQCVVLTDGEACPLKFHKEYKNRFPDKDYDGDKEVFIGMNTINPSSTLLRDRKLGTTYKFGYDYHEFSDVLLCNLRDKFPSVNFIGMRVLENRDANSFMRRYCQWDKDIQVLQTSWRKNKSFVIYNSGYHSYFAISSSNLSKDIDFEVKEDATKTQIKSAFVKSLKGKKMNKKILGEFIELVA